MDEAGFRSFLDSRKLTEEAKAASVAIVQRYEDFMRQRGAQPAAIEDVWAFSELLIAEKNNTYDNYLALVRYGLFAKDNALYVGTLELIDGEEALRNLHARLGVLYGEQFQAEVFAGVGVPPLGTPTSDKPRYTAAVMQRLAERLDPAACKDLLKDSLRDLPDESYAKVRETYQKCTSLDEFLDKQGEAFLSALETLMKEGKPFFAQPITPEVMAYLRQHPEIYRGERDGSIIYEVKIPFMTTKFLEETDPTLKRYYACHCPWAREAIRRGSPQIPAAFCNCSAGFHKKSWEVIFGQKLEVEVLESVLKGDMRCRFAIHLPV